ncbi:hypothetical protein SAMN04515620_11115 [Collimonas sp. OK607]|uniref:hypothetical protein n=1 Tax=Collimonas sp. OK607 TaxID=1798194 RepID=UPI0008EC51FB|nr:hypothetical protein [Collimonas sp. OK607]SFA98737.1 hypothetical protein SAMN04515620_11115 [Collimonas sp. OK607]
MKNTIQILHVVTVAGRSKKTGNDYDMRMAQCIVHKVNRDTGVVEPLVGELVLPERFKETTPGMYEVEFEVAISQQKRVESTVATITSISQKPAANQAAQAPATKGA